MNLRELYTPLIFRLLPIYSFLMIFSGLILMKISEIREDGLFHSSGLLFVLINSLVIILIYADLGSFYSKFKRDALLVIFA